MRKNICFFLHPVGTTKCGSGSGVFLTAVQHGRAFSQFKRKRWFLVRDLYQRGSCINTISASLAPHQLHHTRRSARTQTQTLLRCSVNSAAPLTLYTFSSCTQTFHRVNTQRSTPSTKWAARAATKPALTFYLEYQVQTMFAKSTSNGSLGSTHDKCLPEVRLAAYCTSAQVPESQNASGPATAATTSRRVLLFPDRTDVPSVGSSDLKRGPGQFKRCVGLRAAGKIQSCRGPFVTS